MGLTPSRTLESPVAAQITIDGRRYVNFAGSAYLGLAGHPSILQAGAAALHECGAGYQFARTYGVETRWHREAEAVAATFFDAPAALFLASGYAFALVSLHVLRGRFSAVFLDEWAHSSLREAIAAAGLPTFAFRHLNPEDLAQKLRCQLRADDRPLIVTDGMYSTFGEIAPLSDYASVAHAYGGRLLVDESHSFGVLGEQGRGAVEHNILSADSALSGGSTGKALGVMGGIVLASVEEIAQLRRAPAARGAAPGLPAAAAMLSASLRHVREHPELLQRLRANTEWLKSRLRGLGLQVGSSIAPVATFSTGDDATASVLQRRLMEEGVFVLHSDYVGTAKEGVIRCGIFADHTRAHLEQLVDVLRRLL